MEWEFRRIHPEGPGAEFPGIVFTARRRAYRAPRPRARSPPHHFLSTTHSWTRCFHPAVTVFSRLVHENRDNGFPDHPNRSAAWWRSANSRALRTGWHGPWLPPRAARGLVGSGVGGGAGSISFATLAVQRGNTRQI